MRKVNTKTVTIIVACVIGVLLLAGRIALQDPRFRPREDHGFIPEQIVNTKLLRLTVSSAKYFALIALSINVRSIAHSRALLSKYVPVCSW